MKRIALPLILLLIISMLAGCTSNNSPTNSNTEAKKDDTTQVGFTYKYNKKTKTLSFSGNGVIQEGVEGKDDNSWTKVKNPRHIVVNSGITGIGDFAFFAVDKDEKIAGDTLAKNYFSKIEDVKLSDTVTEIGEDAFCGCKSLKSIIIPPKVKVISEFAFSSCSSLCSVTLGNSVEKIDSYAFEGCKKLEAIKMPNSLKTIGYMSFKNCAELKTVELSDTAKSIALDAFIGCGKLKEITVPKSVEKIGARAFGYSTDKKKVKDFTIKGYKGSAAEKYAKDNEFKFVVIK